MFRRLETFYLSICDRVFPDLPNLIYIGSADSDESVEAFQTYLASGLRPTAAWILTVLDAESQGDHAIYFEVDLRGYVIRGGLTSGYPGQGPKALATVLSLFQEAGCYPVDVGVPRSVLKRAYRGGLTYRQIETIKAGTALPRRSPREYIDIPYHRRSEIWRSSPLVMPMARLDRRLRPIAHEFHDDPDMFLLRASRDLEHSIRHRLGKRNYNDNGDAVKEFIPVAFGGSGVLVWPDLEPKASVARLSMFQSAFSLIRNRRAHRADVGDDYAFEELMLLNMLFVFEAEAEERENGRNPERP